MNDTTRKFPRTLDEAFGEGTNGFQIQDAEENDEPPLTCDSCMRYFGAFCAGVGFVAACIAAGLYFGA